ncbi:hypothetical protein NQ314_019558 [Rhamnusium bicolor]|uniref:Gamma-soluble NSF attachment protein n=1 Tax=Rhamnusium bicolor TaxID=1586634 RepID=A0AAV8WNB3_9CUCU|nr:hypothetical protein NQ314_019558 [Rhamnusium bicolor]
MSGNKKIEEGLEHVKSAEKSLKTSLLKWRPDYENAADEYNKAATCFRNAKSFEQCKDCLLKAVECHKQNRALFYAAKALDQCILVCKELGDLREVASLAERAANMFQTHGSAESAAASLDKAAKILESQHPADALKLFDLAADAIRRELGLHQQNESYRATGRLTVALVLVQLARGDVVAAEKAFKEWGNYCEGPEVQTLETLLQAYDEEDPENAKRALNSSFIKHMDVEYAILARDMPLPEGLPTPPKASVRENAAPSYESPKSQTEKDNPQPTEAGDNQQAENSEKKEANEEDDEYAGGLC